MKGIVCLVLLLANVRLTSCSCHKVINTLVCWKIPSNYDPGCSELVITQTDVGQINSSVLRSDSLVSVITLSIDNAGVTEITESAFSSLSNLRYLSLVGNMLSHIRPDWFGEPAVLHVLNLTRNQIEAVSESMFRGLGNLTHLRLNRNRIHTVHPNSFSSHTLLTELDLSENSMTRVSPQVFRTLRSTKIRLDGNPWDCSCDADESIAAIRDLHNRSLLQRATHVTCDTPTALMGHAVWNVSVCVMSPTPPAPQNNPSEPTDAPRTASDPTAEGVTSTPTQRTTKTHTSVQHRPTDSGMNTDPPRTVPASTATTLTSPPSLLTTQTETSADTGTVSASTANVLTSSPSQPTAKTEASKPTDAHTGTDTSVPPKPSNVPTMSSEPSAWTEPPKKVLPNTVCTLIAVIVVLSVLLSVVCFLALVRRRKRNNKTVAPGRPKEEKKKKLEGDSEEREPEEAWRKSFTGVRAKSADAVVLRSPFGVSVRDQVTLQTESPAEGKQREVNKTEAGSPTAEEDEKPADPLCVPVSVDAVPYLSIGTSRPDDESTEGHRAQTGRGVMGRISSWPATAVQWQARCKVKEEEEGEAFSFWAQNEKFLVEVKKIVTNMEPPPPPTGSAAGRKDEESSQIESSKPNETFSSSSTKEQLQTAESTETQTLNLSPNQDLKPAEPPTHKGNRSSNKAEEKRRPPQRALNSRQKASTSSKAPSGGTSPDDETLLSGNEYAFMNLLHEVVQNNGRWTRDRWRQTHVNKQHR